jgi:hypothetical protein
MGKGLYAKYKANSVYDVRLARAVKPCDTVKLGVKAADNCAGGVGFKSV